MSDPPDWLPPLVYINQFGGEWDRYIEAVYAYFKVDFIDSRPQFQDKAIKLKRYPLLEGREATFWHITSEGKTKSQRPLESTIVSIP